MPKPEGEILRRQWQSLQCPKAPAQPERQRLLPVQQQPVSKEEPNKSKPIERTGFKHLIGQYLPAR